jgi:hypothetical protein
MLDGVSRENAFKAVSAIRHKALLQLIAVVVTLSVNAFNITWLSVNSVSVGAG